MKLNASIKLDFGAEKTTTIQLTFSLLKKSNK